MNKNLAWTVLQGFSRVRGEACPPPCVNTTNEPQPFRHRRGKKSTRPIRFAQLALPMKFYRRPNRRRGLNLVIVQYRKLFVDSPSTCDHRACHLNTPIGLYVL